MMFIRFKTRYDSIRESLKKNNTQLNSTQQADDKTKKLAFNQLSNHLKNIS